MKKEFEKLKKLLKSAKTAIVTAHVDPDGDAIGSMLALGMILERAGLAVTLYCADQVPRIYRFLPGSERIKKELLLQQRFDLGFVVDASDISRVGDRIDLRQAAPIIINIDHHPDNTSFGDINYVTKSSCVAEQVYDLAKYLKIKIDKRIADCLYAAMITDTGNFRYENTTVKTFLIAAELLKAGVNTHEITTRIYDTKSIPSVRVCARALAEVKFAMGHKVAWAVVTDQMMDENGAKAEDLIGLVDNIRSIEGVEVAVLFRQEKGKVKINFRSKEKMNVCEIAKRFGGGGHVKAAGAAVEGEVGQVVERVIAEVSKYIKASSYLV
jgi:phosphoesterase RecJ-like protein